MLGWALTFLISALAAAYLGFFEFAGLAASIARILLVVFVILLAVSSFTGVSPASKTPARWRRRD